MPYVQRRNGVVCGEFANPQPGIAEEFLADDHADVQLFRNPPITPLKAITALETSAPFTHRALREFFIGFAALVPEFSQTLLWQRAKAVDDAIKVERAKL